VVIENFVAKAHTQNVNQTKINSFFPST